VIRWPQSELTCREVVESVTDYLTDSIATPERASFEQHVHACPWCLIYLDQMRQTVALTGQLKDAPLGADIEATLRTTFRARRPT
jgi:hypothetical protein